MIANRKRACYALNMNRGLTSTEIQGMKRLVSGTGHSIGTEFECVITIRLELPLIIGMWGEFPSNREADDGSFFENCARSSQAQCTEI